MTSPTSAPSSVLPSLVRTVVPFVVGLIVTFAASKGVHLNGGYQAQIAEVLTVAVGAVYYAAVRAAEKINPRFGVLLGYAAQPTYKANIPALGTIHVEVDSAKLKAAVAEAQRALLTAQLAALPAPASSFVTGGPIPIPTLGTASPPPSTTSSTVAAPAPPI